MRFALPATRTFAYLCGGAAAGIVLMLVVGHALEAAPGPESHPSIRAGYLAVFFALVLVMAYSAWALMVRSVIGANVAFWTRLAAAIRSRRTADAVTQVAPSARTVGDFVILAGWAVWTLGLAIAVPAMIADMSS